MVDTRHIHKLESTNIYWKWAILTYIYLRLIVMSKRSQEVKVRDVLSYKFIWPKLFDLKLTSAMADRNPSLLKQNDVELSAPQHSHILWFTPPSVTQYSVSCVTDHNHCSLMHVTPPAHTSVHQDSSVCCLYPHHCWKLWAVIVAFLNVPGVYWILIGLPRTLRLALTEHLSLCCRNV